MISEEAAKAAEAAYRETLTELRLREGGGFKVGSQVRRSIHAALEAAAPYMLADAWERGESAGYSQGRAWPEMHPIKNPYRSQA